MNATFRLSKRVRNEAIAGIVFFLLLAMLPVALFFFSVTNVQTNHEVRSLWYGIAILVAIGIFWLGWLVAAVVQLTLYRRYSVTIDPVRIDVHGLLKNVDIPIELIEHLQWPEFSNASVQLRWTNQTNAIIISNFEEKDRLELIRLLRKYVPADKQTGWPLFCYKVALPLRDGPLFRDRHSNDILVTRRRYDTLFRITVPVATSLALVAWFATCRSEALFALFLVPLVLFVFWLMLRLLLPASGRYSEDVLKIPGGRAVLYALAGCYGGLAVVRVLEIRQTHPTITWPILLSWFVLVIALMFRSFPHLEETRRRENELGARSAPDMWQRGEKNTLPP